MAEIKQGNVTVQIPDDIDMMEDAGKLTPQQLARHPDKPRRGVGFAARMTADAMRKNPDRLKVNGVTADELEDYGRQADEIDKIIVDLRVLLLTLEQNNFLLDARAHRALRRVLSFIRAEEKFDPRIVELVPDLIKYFANRKGIEEEEESEEKK